MESVEGWDTPPNSKFYWALTSPARKYMGRTNEEEENNNMQRKRLAIRIKLIPRKTFTIILFSVGRLAPTLKHAYLLCFVHPKNRCLLLLLYLLFEIWARKDELSSLVFFSATSLPLRFLGVPPLDRCCSSVAAYRGLFVALTFSASQSCSFLCETRWKLFA